MDINVAIEVYSQAGGNRLDRLMAVCPDAAIADALAVNISALQRGIVDQVFTQAGDAGLSRDEIGQLAHSCLSATRQDVSSAGVDGLLRYVVWVAWHDGYLRRD